MSLFRRTLAWQRLPCVTARSLRLVEMGLSRRNFYIKLFHWEYWPFGIIQLPLVFMWLWYSLRERSFFYFTASNPGIFPGGMMGESKFEVMAMVPEEVKPKCVLIQIPS